MIGQDRGLRGGATSFEVLMNLGKTGTIFHEIVLLANHKRVLEFTLICGSLSRGLLGFLTTLLNRGLLVFCFNFIFTS
jgi:hypothetical protein